MSKRIIVSLLLICTAAGLLKGQPIQNKEAAAILKKLAASYSNSSSLAFDVLYRYAAESAPGIYLDSLTGQFKTSGSRYWYELDNTESVCTADYVIMLFKEDKLMYLTKQVKPGTGAPADQLAVIDSFLLAGKNIRCYKADTKDRQVVVIEFTVPSLYKRIEFYINRETGYLAKMVSIVQADQLYEAAVRSQIEGPATWAVVETVYSNYRKEAIDESLFNSSRYFKKTGNEFVATAPYGEYKIFLGKTGM